MKKKGFTLIELIVVIAIIGVLAAILVPAMLGYVTKSKITTCNTTAKSIYNAFNTALVDMDTSGKGITSVPDIAKGVTASTTEGSAGYAYKLVSETYFTDITSPTVDDWKVIITSGACTACGVKQGNYIGCYPNPMTVDAYKTDTAKNVASAITRATSASSSTSGGATG